jgi:NADH:ubiquinone oxidoreductase subunit 6 (subunit J)
MDALRQLAWALALVSFSIGGLLVAVGATSNGKRCIALAVVLVLVAPLFEAGLSQLHNMEVRHGKVLSLSSIALVLFLAAVVLAGLVALMRSERRGRGSGATSLKSRVDD